jgi:serine/threonine protein kinase
MSVGPGDRIADRYRIEAWIGQGNMAVVFRARHEGTGRLCALKVVHHHLAARQEIIELFLREARVGSRIGQSPYIVDVLDAGVDQARALPFLAMELLQGQTLDVQIREHGPLDSATVRLLFEQLAEALDQAHAAGVIHRDLKPGNLFLTRDKRGKPCLKIVDFGIAKVLEQEAQRTATQVGSPAYAAPEQMGPTLRRLAEKQGITIAQGISPATDVWALGLIAYELLTGLGGGQYWSQFDTVNDLVMRVVFETPEPPTVRAGPARSCSRPGSMIGSCDA